MSATMKSCMSVTNTTRVCILPFVFESLWGKACFLFITLCDHDTFLKTGCSEMDIIIIDYTFMLYLSLASLLHV